MILKNTTNADINVAGQIVDANGQYTVQSTDLSRFASDDNLMVDIASGDIVVNDGTGDLGAAQGIDLIKGYFPKSVTTEVENITPFASKKIWVSGAIKSLFKRVHGVKSSSIAAGATTSIDLVVPYAHAKFTGAEIFGCELGDTVDFTVHDTANNDISGLDVGTYGANVQLNQFGYDVEMPIDRYKNTSDYDADLFQNMIIRCSYTNNGANAKVVSMNVWLHEVKT